MSSTTGIQCIPFTSFVQHQFWFKFYELKLNHYKLSEVTRKINATFSNRDSVGCIMDIGCEAFNENFTTRPFEFLCSGTFCNKNTIEDFKAVDKEALLMATAKEIWADVESGAILKNPSSMNRFVFLSYADLKKYSFIYWVAFPMPVISAFNTLIIQNSPISTRFNIEDLEFLFRRYNDMGMGEKTFFVVIKSELGIDVKDLQSFVGNYKMNTNFANVYFCFSDPSNQTNSPGWPLRIFLMVVLYYFPKVSSKIFNFVSIRNRNGSLNASILYEIPKNDVDVDFKNLKWAGWEASDGKMRPKQVNLESSLNPDRIAEEAHNLNLKLMSWRMLPDFNLEVNKNAKCLLFGAGTLGCAVARNLTAWGVETITFIDNGKISRSNPARQSLYTYEDTLGRGAMKATTAAKRLREIYPGMKSSGYNLHIPMPGHTVSSALLPETLDSLDQIKKLVQEHDVLFLLTDSRESRWLPTVLGSYYEKIVINSALGFDSYLVMRHGIRPQTPKNESSNIDIDGLRCIRGSSLGCYFCNDVTAPGNSLKDRTLDQQCTVTRPGVSNIASSLAVELLISLLHHKDKANAAAYYAIHNNKKSSEAMIPEGMFGILPHSIRGNLSTFSMILPACEKYSHCTACSANILTEFGKHGNDFLLKAFETTKYLEDLTGLTDILTEEIIDVDIDAEYSDEE